MMQLMHFSSPSKYLTTCEVSSSYEFGKVVSVSGQGTLRRRRRRKRRSMKKKKEKKNRTKIRGVPGRCPEHLKKEQK